MVKNQNSNKENVQDKMYWFTLSYFPSVPSVCIYVCAMSAPHSRNFQDTKVWSSIHDSKCQGAGVSAFKKADWPKPEVELSKNIKI